MKNNSLYGQIVIGREGEVLKEKRFRVDVRRKLLIVRVASH